MWYAFETHKAEMYETVIPDPCGSCKDVWFDKFTSFLSVFSVYCVYFQQSIQSFILRGLKYELLNKAWFIDSLFLWLHRIIPTHTLQPWDFNDIHHVLHQTYRQYSIRWIVHVLTFWHQTRCTHLDASSLVWKNIKSVWFHIHRNNIYSIVV